MGTTAGMVRSRLFFYGAWAAVVGFALLAIGSAVSAPFVDNPYEGTLGGAGVCAISAIAFLPATRMRVNYDDAGVTIVGYMTRRTLRWSEVQDATVGYSGFRLVLESGDEVRVSTIGKGLWSTVRKERNDLDDQVDRLREAIAAHDGHP